MGPRVLVNVRIEDRKNRKEKGHINVLIENSGLRNDLTKERIQG